VLVPVVEVRRVGMTVSQGLMTVPVRVRLRPLAAFMGVPMMGVMRVEVGVLEDFVSVPVLVPLGKEEPRRSNGQG